MKSRLFFLIFMFMSVFALSVAAKPIPPPPTTVHICAGNTDDPPPCAADFLVLFPTGTWSSSDPDVATVHPTTGVVTGVSPGTVTITFVAESDCGDFVFSYTLTVDEVPGAITGTAELCVGSTTTLTGSPTGGTWTSGTPAVATVVAGTGLVTGVAPGTAIISYTLSSGCYSTVVVTVNALPTIEGSDVVCLGQTTTLIGVPSGGTWTSSTPSVATVHVSTGIVSGVTLGTTTITYSISAGCIATKVVTVVAPPVIDICEVAPIETCDDAIAYCTGLKLNVTIDPLGDITPVWSVLPTTGPIPTLDVSSGYYVFSSAPAAGTYTLTATVTSGGCVVSTSITLFVAEAGCYPCDYFKACGGTGPTVNFKTIPGNVLSSANISTTTADYYYIPVTSTLNVSPAVGSVFFMGKNVELKMLVSGDLTLTGCHFFSSASCKWKGISMLTSNVATSRLKVDGNTLIEHTVGSARGAITNNTSVSSSGGYVPTTGYILDCSSAIFNQNENGLYLLHHTGASAELPYFVKNSVFTSRNFCLYSEGSTSVATNHYPFKWPSANDLKATSESGLSPAFGVDDPLYSIVSTTNSVGVNLRYMYKTGDATTFTTRVTIGDNTTASNYNLFDVLTTGMLVYGSSVVSYNNIFRKCNMGVSVAENKAQCLWLLNNNATEANTHNRFYNCKWGGYSTCCFNFKSIGSVMKTNNTPSTTGVDYYYGLEFANPLGTYLQNHEIKENTMLNIANGVIEIFANNMFSSGTIDIEDNIFTISASEHGRTGITISDKTESSSGTAVSGIRISDNVITGFQNGISIGKHLNTLPYSGVNVEVESNTIVMMYNYPTGATRAGITSCYFKNLEMKYNHVYGDVTAGTAKVNYNTPTSIISTAGAGGTHSGFVFSNVGTATEVPVVSCNFTHDMPAGFRFERNNTVNWNNNVMMRHKYGLLLHSDEIGGTLVHGTMGDQGTICNPSDNIWYDEGDPGSTGWTNWTNWSDPTDVYQTYVVGTNPTHSKLYVRHDTTGSHRYAPTKHGASTLPASYSGTAYHNWTTIINSTLDCTGTLSTLEDPCAPAVPAEEEIEERSAPGGDRHTKFDKVKDAFTHYTISPNPGNGDFIIKQSVAVDGDVKVTVRNYAGALISTENLSFRNGAANLKIEKVASGMYMVVLVNEKGENSSFKVVIQ